MKRGAHPLYDPAGQCRTTSDHDPFEVLALSVGKEVLDRAAHLLDHGVQAGPSPDAAETSAGLVGTMDRLGGLEGSPAGLGARVQSHSAQEARRRALADADHHQLGAEANDCFEPAVRPGRESP
jgi:hypothetical protein